MNPASRDQVQNLTPEQENDAAIIALSNLLFAISWGTERNLQHALYEALIPIRRRGIVGFERKK